MSDTEEAAVEDMESDHDREIVKENISKDHGVEEEVKDLTTKRGASPLMYFENQPTSPSPPPGDEGSKSLHQLARDGDIETIKAWFSGSQNDPTKFLNELDEKKLSPLHYAARHSNIEVMKVLVENGANINRQGDDKMTPLHYAARYGRLVIPREQRRHSAISAMLYTPAKRDSITLVDVTESDQPDEEAKNLLAVVKAVENKVDIVVDYLVDNGADVNAQDKYGMTPMHHTAIRGNRKALQRLLISPGIIKEPRDAQDSTPLHLAATYNQPSIAKILLYDGQANPRAIDKDLRTPLHEACQEGNVLVAKILLETAQDKFGPAFAKAMTGDRDDGGATPLLLGVGKGGTSIIHLLLSFHANPNQRNKDNVFPVHSAARTGNLDTLVLLYQSGAIINCLNVMHQTPLYLAAENNHLDIIEFLLDPNRGADINKWSVDGMTPIIAAAIEGHDGAVDQLFSKGANLGIYDKDDCSVLFHAAQMNRVTVLQSLLSHVEGRDLLEVTDQYDNLPIHVASREGNVESVRILIEAGSSIDRKNEDEQTPIHLAAIHGRVDVVEELLEKDRSTILDEDENSNTALHLACTNKKYKTAEILLKSGADVHSRNAKRWTPLDCAASAGAMGCAKLLIEANASIDSTDRTKCTPLHLAADYGHAEMVALLLAHGADISKDDSQSRNALERAVIKGEKKCVKAILEHEDWKKALRTSHPTRDDHGTIVPETPLRLLVKKYPDLAELVFNNCMTESTLKDPLHPDTSMPVNILTMNYEFIDDAFFIKSPDEEGQFYQYCSVDEKDDCIKFKKAYNGNARVVMDNHPLMIMAREEQKNLLRHPLCLALVRRKWIKYGRYLYYISLLPYLVFLVFLTSYALLTPNARVHLEYSKDIEEGLKFCQDLGNITSRNQISEKTTFFHTCQIMILVISLFNCLMELIQFYRSGHRYLQWTNLFDWVVYIFAIFVVLDFQENSLKTGKRTCWQWEMTAVNLTLAWLNLLGDVRQLPFLGIYVIMFFDILKTFLRFGIVFVIFIVAFGLGFHLLLINQTPFKTVGYSLLKTSVMMTGEFEYESIFHNESNHLESDNLTFFFYLAFLIIMSIIVVNLLIGLAVDDIKAVQDQAILKRLAMQVELVLDVERLLPNFLLRRLTRQKESIKHKQKRWWNLFTDVVDRSSIIKDAHQLTNDSQRNSTSQLLEVLDTLSENIKNLKFEMKKISEENKENRRLLNALADRNSIYIDDGDSVSVL